MLIAGFAERLVVENQNGKVHRGGGRHRRQAADAHHHFAVAGDHENASIGLGERQAEADRAGKPHAAPEIDVAIIAVGSRQIPGRGAEPADHQRVAAPPKQMGDQLSAIEAPVFQP